MNKLQQSPNNRPAQTKYPKELKQGLLSLGITPPNYPVINQPDCVKVAQWARLVLGMFNITKTFTSNTNKLTRIGELTQQTQSVIDKEMKKRQTLNL